MNYSTLLEKCGAQLRPALFAIGRRMFPWLRRRVPVRLQLSRMECGASCLAMILSYYGRHVSVVECRAAIDTTSHGAQAYLLAEAGRSFGLLVKAYAVPPPLFQQIWLPAIVHWEGNHFVVVERWTARAIDIVDPAVGRYRVNSEEFAAKFSGVALTFEPGPGFVRARPANRSFWRPYAALLLQSPRLLLQIVAASLAIQVIGLLLPWFTKLIVDHILPMRLNDLLPLLGVSMVLLVIAFMVINYLRAAMLLYLQAHLDTQLVMGFFEHLLSLPFRFFEERGSGDLMMRFGSNIAVRDLLANQSVALLLDGLLIVVSLGIVVVYHPWFAFAICIIGTLQSLVTLCFSSRMQQSTQRELMARAEEQNVLIELIGGIATVKACGIEKRMFDYWSRLFVQQLRYALERSHLVTLVETMINGVRVFAPLVLLWLGIQQVIAGYISLGSILALNTLGVMVLTPLAFMIQAVQRLLVIGVQLERLADVLQAAPEQDPSQVQPAPFLSGRIELRDVSFRYSSDTPLVLCNINLSIAPGQHVALVGRTGSGKSTLARLLLGLYPPTAGAIYYDGQRLSSINYQALRRQFGVVLQDVRLFNGSIRQNIALHEPDMPLERIIAAARQAAIHEDILRLPAGYDTQITENGSCLSGGQRQRLAIARALVHQPCILVLDEATSHLDVITERLVEQQLGQLDSTHIVVAHRLSTVQHADLIVVLDHGIIVEQGTHDVLLARNGYYAALIRDQLLSPGGACMAFLPEMGAARSENRPRPT